MALMRLDLETTVCEAWRRFFISLTATSKAALFLSKLYKSVYILLYKLQRISPEARIVNVN
ncbi:MAG: hypothetical protein PHI04_08550, partial [Clostridiaceae bacterium]|nr:hypothetical protein [Clostridiaceae bacterium]